VRCAAKIRYNHDPQPARVSLTDQGDMLVRFDQPQSAITPGQAVVAYDGDVLLGGGWIEGAVD
jgi:tRNA-specific 2-thiouridylase